VTRVCCVVLSVVLSSSNGRTINQVFDERKFQDKWHLVTRNEVAFRERRLLLLGEI